MNRSIAVALTALVSACGNGEEAREEAASPDAAPEPRPVEASAWMGDGVQIRLVDSIPWETALASGIYHRVAVRRDGVVDTLPGVEVESRPVVVGDSVVYGFDWSSGEVERGFRWTAGSGTTTLELPDDFLGFTAFGLAPDAAHLVYVGEAEEAPSGEIRLKAVVRGWPEGEVVWESHRVAGYPSGGKNSAVDWLSADSVEVRIRLDDLDTPGGSWLRVAGSPVTGAFTADTVRGG